MNHVSPVFTEYEQQVIRELAVHRVQPNAVHRLHALICTSDLRASQSVHGAATSSNNRMMRRLTVR